MDRKLHSTLKNLDKCYFIQVGANDGCTNDPLHSLIQTHKGWSGVFVEPVKCYYDRLVESYGNDPRFIIEKVAIGDKDGKGTMYYLPSAVVDTYPDLWWAYGAASLNRQHLLSTCGERIAAHIQEEEVEIIAFETLCKRNHISHVDLILIDTEGHDYRILQQIDVRKYEPIVIAYEHKHLAEDERRAAHEILLRAGYKLSKYGDDVLAVKKWR